MGYIQANEIEKKRKNQVIKWDFNKSELNDNSIVLNDFLERLGFKESDDIQICFIQEQTGVFLTANPVSFKEIKGKNISNINVFYDSKNYGTQQKFLKTQNEDAFGVFFAVSGVRNGSERKVRVQFIDYDCGKDTTYFNEFQKAHDFKEEALKNASFEKVELHTQASREDGQIYRYAVKTYKKQTIIEKLKLDFLEKNKQFLNSAIVINTKNGFHIYWVVEEGKKELFSPLQAALARKFGSDTSVTDLARVLRLPSFYHLKDISSPYLIEVVHWGEREETGGWKVHTQQELIENFGLQALVEEFQTVLVPNKIENVERKVVVSTALKMRKKIQIECSGKTMSFPEFLEEVKNKSLYAFFENEEFNSEGQAFCCHFHSDSKPSATTYEMNEGNFVYHCFSDSCQTRRSVVDMIMDAYKMNFFEAVNSLASKCGVTIALDEFQQRTYQTLNMNFQWIKLNLEGKNKHFSDFPLLYSYISKSMKRLLKEMMVQLQSYPIRQEWSYEDKPIFFMSFEYLSEELEINLKTVKQYVNLLALLGFIRKIHHADVPLSLYKRFEGKKVVNYYSLPLFEDIASEAETIVSKIKEIKFKKNQVDFEYIALSFGLDKARQVFPNDNTTQIKPTRKTTNRKVRQKVENAQTFLENTASEVIRKKKYIKESVLLERLSSQEFPIFSKEKGETLVRKLLEGEMKAIYENFKVSYAMQGYKRTTLSLENSKILGLKNSQKRGERIYIWMKK